MLQQGEQLQRFLIVSLCGFFLAATLGATVNEVTEPLSPDVATKCMLWSLAVYALSLTIGRKLSRPAESVFFWFTPITSRQLYRKYGEKHATFLLWVFAFLPCFALMFAMSGKGGPALLAPVIAIAAFLAYTAAVFNSSSHGFRFDRLLVNPSLVSLRPKNRSNYRAVWWLGFLIVAGIIFEDELKLSFSLSSYIGSIIFAVADQLRSIPVIGLVLSFLWCPLLELGRLDEHPQSFATGLILLAYLVVALLVQLPEILKTLREREPAWRRAEELRCFEPLVSVPLNDLGMEAREEEESTRKLLQEKPSAEKDKIVRTGAYVIAHSKKAFTYLGIFIFWVIIVSADRSISGKFMSAGILALLIWAIGFPVFGFMDAQARGCWLPARRIDVLRKGLFGRWWEWCFAAAVVLVYCFTEKLNPLYGLWGLLILLLLRVALVALMILDAHRTLGRGKAAWIHLFGCFAGVVAIFVTVLAGLSVPQMIAGILASLLIPTITGLGGMWFEHAHVGGQLYVPVDAWVFQGAEE